MPSPLALSDTQFDAVCAAAAPLLVADRGPFLIALAKLLSHEPQPLGDGAVFRAIKSLQREFWRPPATTRYDEPVHGRRKVGAPIA